MSTVAKKKDGATTSDKPFILSEGLPPVPAKLVARILRGEFIDMAELLRDNLEAQRRAALQETLATPGPSMPRPRQEVPDILSWVQCFSIYTAVIASKFPERVQKLLVLHVKETTQQQHVPAHPGVRATSHSPRTAHHGAETLNSFTAYSTMLLQ